MFVNIRKLKAFLLGADAARVTSDAVIADLKAAAVPISLAGCRTCPDPCDEGHEEYPSIFSLIVDMETFMLGSVKPYQRQLVISTGKSDWQREVTEATGSLAAYLSETQSKPNAPVAIMAERPSGEPPGAFPDHHPVSDTASTKSKPVTVEGIFDTSSTTRVSILNGSHKTVSGDHERETVLVFPDYKLVTEVPRSKEGAAAFWTGLLGEGDEREGSTFKSWVLPYSCVILICSHKKRDNRCSIVAPKLEQAFISSLSHHDWVVDTQLEHPDSLPLEGLPGTPEEKSAATLEQLRELPGQKRALVLMNSHIGGHKFVGNVIIYTPQGSGVWYGRVTTHEVESIVTNTILGGEILVPLLRGGANIGRVGCKTLHDW